MTDGNRNGRSEPVYFVPLDGAEWESLAAYRKRGGYQALEKTLREKKPEDVVQIVKDSGLRGRGGAGFPAGVKWGFLPKDHPGPRYLVCNADESEPGTCKDRIILERYPHLLIEGLVLTAFAIRCQQVFVYIRGEYFLGLERLNAALDEARAAGYVGSDIQGTGVNISIVTHKGAGAYICGEETSLLNSLEGKRGYPRLKPPFPAVVGLYGKPTIINNVETIATVPLILQRGVAWFRSFGTEKSPGPRLYCISGHVKRPGVYEAPQDVTLRELLFDERYAGGMRDGRSLKAVIPGGSSTPLLLPDQIDVQMNAEALREVGTMPGSAGIIVMDDTTCMIWACLRVSKFYHHESCGQCTPCREGTGWLERVMTRMEAGRGTMEELDLLLDICRFIEGRSICALGDAAIPIIRRTVQCFRDEFEAHIRHGGCPFDKQYLIEEPLTSARS